MISLEQTKNELREEYNDNIEIYDYTGVIRLTNGSCGMFLNIQTDGDEFTIAGRRYDERILKRCNRTSDELIETLSRTI